MLKITTRIIYQLLTQYVNNRNTQSLMRSTKSILSNYEAAAPAASDLLFPSSTWTTYWQEK